MFTAGMTRAEVQGGSENQACQPEAATEYPCREALKTRRASQRPPPSTLLSAPPVCWHQRCPWRIIPWLTSWMPWGGHCPSNRHCPSPPAPRRCRSWTAGGAQAVSTNAKSPQPRIPRASVLTTWPKWEKESFSQNSQDDAGLGSVERSQHGPSS